ncbi:MAG: twin-arginine translocation signal domain-containing protein [Oscillospiraceae bacterium]|nr:twin-arginine translocation signal domain-containing protein [Oscillospiraceae bacterium]
MSEISRRTFLKGSAAIAGTTLLASLGLNASAEADQSDKEKAVSPAVSDRNTAERNAEEQTAEQKYELIISDEIAGLMEERGIREEDVQEVVVFAESSGKKLYIEGEEHYLARKRIGKFTAYVEYSVSGSEVEVLDVYSHTLVFPDDVLEENGES